MSAELSQTSLRPAGCCRILTFHKLSSRFTFGATNFSPQRLAHLLDYLTTGRGYVFRPIPEVLNAGGSDSLAISFDDAYEDLARELPAFIETYGLRPVVFVPTRFIGRPATWDYSYRLNRVRHLTESEMRSLYSMGVEFGSHGHSHIALTGLDKSRLTEELSRSKGVLEALTGERVRYMSYPFGRFDARVMDQAAEAGYEHGFTMKFPTPRDTKLAMGRLAVYGYDSAFAVTQKVSNGLFYPVERAKAAVTNRLSGGTILYNRLSRSRGRPESGG